MCRRIFLFLFSLLIVLSLVQAQKGTPVFKIIPLGTEGGLNESNLSAYMVAPVGSDNFICLDAGTLYSGVNKAIQNHIFNKRATSVIRQNIKAYCISHPHLDHVAGLIINSPSDTSKNIYGTAFCLDRIQQYYFSWQTWANFGDSGEKPVLNKYHFERLQLDSEVAIQNTNLFVTAFKLSHANPYESTAFLVRKDSNYVLYFGDTGADTIEHSQCIQHIWQTVAPLINSKQLKGIFIEVSYPDEQSAKQLFGHLTPALLMQEIQNLSTLCNKNALANLPVIITHMKPEGNNEKTIMREVKASNSFRLRIIFPQQGIKMEL